MGKARETAMWRAPISAEFTVYCFKNLNLSVRSPWTWATTCLQRALINVYMTPGSWGAAEVTGRNRWNDFAPQWDSFPQTHSLIMCPSLHPQVFGGPTHCPGRKSGNLECGGREASRGQGSRPAWGPWAAGFPEPAKESSSGYTTCHWPLRAAPVSLAERAAPGCEWRNQLRCPPLKKPLAHHSLRAKVFFQ